MVRKKLALIFLVAIFLSLGTGCSGTEPEAEPSALEKLAAVQVTEYKGEKLSSITAFRENSILGPQVVDIKNYKLQIDGLVAKPQVLTYDQVLAKPAYSKVVTLHCVEGWQANILWQGVLLSDLFQAAGIKSQANTVIFHAVDGYTTSLPLQTILEKKMLLAYQMNGVVLPQERGYPFQLVAEDKLGYKWIKWLNRIEISDQDQYQGYWESRGYDNDADVED